MIFIALLVFEVNSVQRVEVDKKGDLVATFLDWPAVNKSFNDSRSSTYSGARRLIR